MSSNRAPSSQPRLLAVILKLAFGRLDPSGGDDTRESYADRCGTVNVPRSGLASERLAQMGGEVVAIASEQVI
jgi:hypothetical protein